MSERRHFFNGIDGSTGRYLLPPLTSREIAALACGEGWEVKPRLEPRSVIPDCGRDPVFGNDACELCETGWGVIYAPGTPPGVKRALEPLLEHRRSQAESYFRTFEYEPGQTADGFLTKGGARPDCAADPDRGVPYYLLLVGDPEALPYRFQYELDVRYAVGRLHFDREEDYAIYAESVVAAERQPRLPRQVALFGPRHAGDPSTESTAAELIEPLGRTLIKPCMDWTSKTLVGPDANKAKLGRILGGPETPALLLAACHGVLFPEDDDRQLRRQGGLICHDWPGPEDEVGVLREHYFTAEDLAPDSRLHGLVAFLFACYSAGTPDRDSYYNGEVLGKPRRIAPRPFVSRLCQGLLSHPNGGALAVVGHVDRAWTSSFQGSARGEGADNFLHCLRRLLDGHTVGAAMEYFNHAYATLSARLSNSWEARHNSEPLDWDELADLWLANNDARNFVVFGDPAVKLAVGR